MKGMQWGDLSSIIAGLGVRFRTALGEEVLIDILENVPSH
jgi:hypothetical protein